MPISLRSSVHSIPKPWPSVLNLDVNMSNTNAKIAEELISSILSQAYILRGRQENEGLLRQVHERCPDYLFSRVNLAHLAIRDGDLNRAKELLEPLVKRRRLHYSELGAFVAPRSICWWRKASTTKPGPGSTCENGLIRRTRCNSNGAIGWIRGVG